jgi:hypothetical protein
MINIYDFSAKLHLRTSSVLAVHFWFKTCFYVRILNEFVLLMSLTMTPTACIAFNLKRFSLQIISLLILKQNLNQYSIVNSIHRR